MQLSGSILKDIVPAKVSVPAVNILELPEKVLQFGTGILLRGLPDYFIDKANRMGIFNGRIVMVKSTNRGDAALFEKQDGLYTLCIRGIEDGAKVEENIINSSVSRVLIAKDDWKEVLKCAHNKDLHVIISNTTEVGIKLMNEDIRGNSPASYPGKLLAFLYERFIAFNGDKQSGFVIIPTELIPNNGEKLKSIVVELAHLNNLSDVWIEWLQSCNYFCNSLVDRIVTGMPDDKTRKEIEKELGYTDDLMTMCEVYRLWAIEGDSHVKQILSFAEADEGMIIEPNIELHRELKLRLLNGTHTLSCGVAFLCGIDTVKEAMDNEMMAGYIADLMQQEIGPSIPYNIDIETIQLFTAKVLNRFRNPHLNHQWKNITLNYSSKMRVRCLPLLFKYYEKNGKAPELFAIGFAAYLYFMKPVKKIDDEYFGENNGENYLIQDEMAGKFYEMWSNMQIDELVKSVLKDIELWGEDLTMLPGFQQSVTQKLNSIVGNGMNNTIKNAIEKKIMSDES